MVACVYMYRVFVILMESLWSVFCLFNSAFLTCVNAGMVCGIYVGRNIYHQRLISEYIYKIYVLVTMAFVKVIRFWALYVEYAD
jgi:hypothetical protein